MTTPFLNSTGSASIGATEFSFPANANYASGSPQTTAEEIEPYLDLSNMIAGDQYRVRIYDKVNGGTQTPIFESYPTGAQATLYRLPPIRVQEGWDVTAKLIAGSARTIGWALKRDTGDVTGTVVEGANTLAQIMRLLTGVIAGKVADFSTGTLVFKSLDGTKTRLSVTTDATGRLTITPGDLS